MAAKILENCKEINKCDSDVEHNVRGIIIPAATIKCDSADESSDTGVQARESQNFQRHKLCYVADGLDPVCNFVSLLYLVESGTGAGFVCISFCVAASPSGGLCSACKRIPESSWNVACWTDVLRRATGAFDAQASQASSSICLFARWRNELYCSPIVRHKDLGFLSGRSKTRTSMSL